MGIFIQHMEAGYGLWSDDDGEMVLMLTKVVA